MAYSIGAIDKELLAQAVITKKNPYGEITPEEYELICKEDFITQ
ncbi:XkdX family protein [Clostridium botulinum]|nr:XkdX family protein [Clostridium botulinum]MBN3398166.1 XkdX family protein [Clostridium botulinum]MBN3413206.1 XkdX family protein [Clostridium botulinum]NEZ84598.1 XkdX family protein [Clostridium botulinum]NFA07701.1 XkdX family protein [Clostridium botulinum]NFA26080.1 XkdX family protein [Clostridium botulinum]